jgi:polysaccharide export outer membrane protein
MFEHPTSGACRGSAAAGQPRRLFARVAWRHIAYLVVAILTLAAPVVNSAQAPTGVPAQEPVQVPAQVPAAPVQEPAPEQPNPASQLKDYRIGPGDVLAVLFWREKELSGEVVVRPDGLITLPVLNEVQAAGLTTEELRTRVTERAMKFVTQAPIVSIVVRQINSRSVYITGKVHKPGPYTIYGPMRVLQLIALAGGLAEFADSSKIMIVRTENDKQTSFLFNYKDVVKKGLLDQNIALQPGDTVVVP